MPCSNSSSCFNCGECDHTSKTCPEFFTYCSCCDADIDTRKPETVRNCLECGDPLCVTCVGKEHARGYCSCVDVHIQTAEWLEEVRLENEASVAAEAAAGLRVKENDMFFKCVCEDHDYDDNDINSVLAKIMGSTLAIRTHDGKN